jgi:hypothetical protein
MTTGAVLASVMLIIAQVPGDDPNAIVVWAENAPEDAVLSIHRVDGSTGSIGPAMFAKVEQEDEKLKLTPSFKLSAGSKYRAVIQTKDGKVLDAADYVTKAVRGPPPQLTEIYPRSKQLPANLLKFYLYFDQPMREGREIFDWIHIEDESGKRVHAPWRRLELWNENATRLTLWIHPGRIKRGVNLREQLGPVLVPGKHYTLVIEKSVRSAKGIPLGKEFRHTFLTLAEDHERPSPQAWTMKGAIAGTRLPLEVESPEPLDHALLSKYGTVYRNGKLIHTTFSMGIHDNRFSLFPCEPWEPAEYEVRVGKQLEDLAGNTPERVFDTDLSIPEEEPAKLVIPFRVK